LNPYRSAVEAAVDLAGRGLPLAAADRLDSALDEAFKHGLREQSSLLARG